MIGNKIKLMISKLKEKWRIKSTFDFIVIFIVFGITGASSVYVRKYVFEFLGIEDNMNFFLKVLLYIIVMFPAYQILLVIYGFMFGKFTFFWTMEKKILKRIGFKYFFKKSL